MNEYVQEKRWWSKKRYWILTIIGGIGIVLIMAIGPIFQKPIGDVTKAMVDTSIMIKHSNGFVKTKVLLI